MRYGGISWVEALNETASALGPANLFPLEAASLSRENGVHGAARRAMDVLVESLNTEANLSGLGRLFARIELLRSIRARAFLISHEGDANAAVFSDGPLFIAGYARSGTTALHQWFASSTQWCAPTTVEILYPDLPAGPAASAEEAQKSVTAQDRLWDLADPAFAGLHLNRGDLPAECVPVLSAGFLSDHWTGCYRIPSYRDFLENTSSLPSYILHKKFAEITAKRHETRLLAFKAPTHILRVQDVLQAFPRARLVLIDREPREATHSHRALLSSIRNMRSVQPRENTDHADACTYFLDALTRTTEALEGGVLHDGNLYLLRHDSLISDARGAVERIMTWLGSEYDGPGVPQDHLAPPRRPTPSTPCVHLSAINSARAAMHRAAAAAGIQHG